MLTDQELSTLIGSQLAEIITAIGNEKLFHVEIPDPADVDLTPTDLASLVARTSNTFGRWSRLAGMARAETKLAKARYDRRFKTERRGGNEAERDAAGMVAAQTEHEQLAIAESLAETAEGFEAAARVASESARKLLDAVIKQDRAQTREEAGRLRSADFRPY